MGGSFPKCRYPTAKKRPLCSVPTKHRIFEQAKCITGSRKELRLRQSLQHLTLVQKERKFYNELIKECSEELKEKSINGPIFGAEKCSYPGKMHYGFDFAQQISLPFSSQQVGPIYFLSGFKVALFGVALEPFKKFILYIIPESCTFGKGANMVISLLHHCLENFSVGEQVLHLHADNCQAQNKNNIVMQYLAYRVQQGLNNSCHIHFLLVGHTKFMPDMYFGIVKQRFRKSEAYTVKDVVKIALDSCSVSKAITPVFVGNERGQSFIKIYDWMQFFKANKVVRIPMISSYQHFKMNDGSVHCRKDLSEPEGVKHTLFPKDLDGNAVLNEILPQNLGVQRRKYLHQKFSEYLPSKVKKYFLWRQPRLRKVEER